MPGPKPCEIGCTCGHHPDGKLSPEAYAEQRRLVKRTRHKKRTPEQQRGYYLKSLHGMSLEEWDAMWAAQGGRCCYCESQLPVNRKLVHIDHDHSCCAPKRSCALCRRGLACQNCNFVIGNALDDPDRLELIAANLRKLKLTSAPPRLKLTLTPTVPRLTMSGM